MKKVQFEKINELLNKLVIHEQPVLYSGKSLNIIINHFSRELQKERWDRGKKDLDFLLEYWEENIAQFKSKLFESASDANSFIEVNGSRTILIREDDAFQTTKLCPPGPKPLIF